MVHAKTRRREDFLKVSSNCYSYSSSSLCSSPSYSLNVFGRYDPVGLCHRFLHFSNLGIAKKANLTCKATPPRKIPSRRRVSARHIRDGSREDARREGFVQRFQLLFFLVVFIFFVFVFLFFLVLEAVVFVLVFFFLFFVLLVIF